VKEDGAAAAAAATTAAGGAEAANENEEDIAAVAAASCGDRCVRPMKGERRVSFPTAAVERQWRRNSGGRTGGR
jgi:hypothetical protein